MTGGILLRVETFKSLITSVENQLVHSRNPFTLNSYAMVFGVFVIVYMANAPHVL